MSLVAYGSSDESSEDEGNEEPRKDEADKMEDPIAAGQTNGKLNLPPPKCDSSDAKDKSFSEKDSEKIHFEKLPKPKSVGPAIAEDDDDLPEKLYEVEKQTRKDRAPVKITVPSLSEFRDIDEESDRKVNKIMPSKKGTGLFALLPPPKTAEIRSKNALIPQVVAKQVEKSQMQKQETKNSQVKQTNSLVVQNTSKPVLKKSLELSNYDSNSEDEDNVNAQDRERPTTDFFALTTHETLPDPVASDVNNIGLKKKFNDLSVDKTDLESKGAKGFEGTEDGSDNSQRTLISNIMNLPKEEILMKNKATVGPKLPVPEQEYNIDQEGNVAFDEKAIEYLCGRRGIKRKNKEINEANIIEINGEDIKPDEREWLVKALTEEPIQRPVSIGAGVNSQSKKKHQITYLAHQAKAMEMELKNQWAQNRMTRKQTQSKYGF